MPDSVQLVSSEENPDASPELGLGRAGDPYLGGGGVEHEWV